MKDGGWKSVRRLEIEIDSFETVLIWLWRVPRVSTHHLDDKNC